MVECPVCHQLSAQYEMVDHALREHPEIFIRMKRGREVIYGSG